MGDGKLKAVPGGFNAVTAARMFGGTPADYQMTAYCTQVGASGAQVTGLATFVRQHKGGHASFDEIQAYLATH
jgi:hypothetical protein